MDQASVLKDSRMNYLVILESNRCNLKVAGSFGRPEKLRGG
jgi:hypothetical protein